MEGHVSWAKKINFLSTVYSKPLRFWLPEHNLVHSDWYPLSHTCSFAQQMYWLTTRHREPPNTETDEVTFPAFEGLTGWWGWCLSSSPHSVLGVSEHLPSTKTQSPLRTGVGWLHRWVGRWVDGWVIEGRNQGELVWKKRHLLRAHPLPFFYILLSFTTKGTPVWSFSGPQVLANLILLIQEIYLSDSNTCVFHSFEKPLLSTFYRYFAFQGQIWSLNRWTSFLAHEYLCRRTHSNPIFFFSSFWHWLIENLR